MADQRSPKFRIGVGEKYQICRANMPTETNVITHGRSLIPVEKSLGLKKWILFSLTAE